MFSMLVTSIEDWEIDSWMSRITTYLKLLKEHSINFDTTKLACIRLELLSKVDQLMEDGRSHRTDESNDGVPAPLESIDSASTENREQAQLGDGNMIYSVDDTFEFISLDPFGDSENLDWDALMGVSLN